MNSQNDNTVIQHLTYNLYSIKADSLLQDFDGVFPPPRHLPGCSNGQSASAVEMGVIYF